MFHAAVRWLKDIQLTSFHSYFTKYDIFFRASVACRVLQKVSKAVEMYFVQWHSSLYSIHNTHLDFCTASNVHKNIFNSYTDRRS